jgi:hypothetical protein
MRCEALRASIRNPDSYFREKEKMRMEKAKNDFSGTENASALFSRAGRHGRSFSRH